MAAVLLLATPLAAMAEDDEQEAPLAVPADAVWVAVPATHAAPPPPAPSAQPQAAAVVPPSDPEPDGSGVGVGLSAGLTSGLGLTVRVPVGDKNRVAVTAFPIYIEGDGMISGGVRVVHFFAEGRSARLTGSIQGAAYLMDRELLLAPGAGIGIELGHLSPPGFAWWAEIVESGVIIDQRLVFASPLPQTGFLVEF